MAEPGESNPSGEPSTGPSDAGQSGPIWARALAIGVTFAVLLLALKHLGDLRIRELPWWQGWGLRLIALAIAFALVEGLVRVYWRLFSRGRG
jgi:hypothetical protein